MANPKKNQYYYIVLIQSITFLSAIILRTAETMVLYTLVSVIVVFIVIIKSIILDRFLQIGLFRLTIFDFWVISLFSMYFFYGLVIKSYDYFSVEYFLFMFGMIYTINIVLNNIEGKLIGEALITSSYISAFLASLYVLLREWDSILVGYMRIGDSVSGNVNTLAIYLGVLSIPILFAIIYKKRIGFIFPYIFIIFIMLSTGSKKSLLYIGLSIIILGFIKYKYKIYRYIPYVIGFILMLFFVLRVEYFYNILGHRVIDFLGALGFDISQAQESNSTNLRMSMIINGMELFLQHPFKGNGWGYFTKYAGFNTYSHNNYIEILVNYGIFGFFLYYSMYLYLIKNLFRYIKRDDNLYSILLVTILLVTLITDFAYISFSFNIINYFVLVISFRYMLTLKTHTNSVGKSVQRVE